jgi:hypothetical protein
MTGKANSGSGEEMQVEQLVDDNDVVNGGGGVEGDGENEGEEEEYEIESIINHKRNMFHVRPILSSF